MPLLLVLVQNFPYLQIKPVVILLQPLRKVLVYCGFGNSELLGGSPYSGSGFDHVHSQLAGPFSHVVFHMVPSDAVCLGKIYAKRRGNMTS